jgi:hypothetical protein
MFGIPDDLIVRLDAMNAGSLLEHWRWLITEDLRPWFATALGDLFLHGADGRVWWLDVGSGELTCIARDAEHFRELLSDPDSTNLWFGEALVDRLRGSGIVLAPGQCYSYLQLPILGGEYEPSNFRIYDVLTHFRVWGPIHQKVKDIPDGTTIRFVIDEGQPGQGVEAVLSPEEGVEGQSPETSA